MTKTTNEVSQKSVNSFFDRGDGVVEFPNGLVITDDSVMWSGTKYDIESLDINEYPGQLTLDHWDSIGGDTLIGKVEGVHKEGNKVVVDRIRYAINASENAKRAYNLLVGGFSNAFSIETIGPWADEENTMHNHKLVGLSQVVMGNNKHAVANSIDGIKHTNEKGEEEDTENCVAKHEIRVESTVEPQVEEKGEDMSSTKAQANGEQEEVLETLAEELKNETFNEAEKAEEQEDATAEEPKVERPMTQSAPSDEENPKADGVENIDTETTEVENSTDESDEEEKVEESEEEEAETEAEEVENEAKAPEEDIQVSTEEEPADEKVQVNTKNNNAKETEMTKEEISKLINEAIKNFAEAQVSATPEVEEPKKEEVEVNEADKEEPYSLEKHANLILRALKTRSAMDYDKLARVNNSNLEALKAAGKVSNSMTIEDWGNFVLPPEMYDKLVGGRTDYSAILDATDWRETDRLEFAWLTRNGDIEMQNTAMCEARPADPKDTSNLKPISQYGAVQHIEQMEHLAAVTPVCSAATKYLVVDLVADAIAGYRNNYDKKRAELVIAKLQEAVNETNNKVQFNNNGTSDDKLTTFIETMAELSNVGSTGTFIFTEKTLFKIMEYITPRESALGDRAFDAGKDGIRRIFGTPYIVVPNSLMPSLEGDTANNPKYSYIPKDASSTAPQDIEITSTVFYGDLSLFTGYTSGGLIFDMTEQAAYELPDGTVRSAFQRDEIVLRGYFYRGAAYRQPEAMAAITNEKA